MRLDGKHIVIYGLDSLTVRVVRRLAARGASLAVVYRTDPQNLEPMVRDAASLVQCGADREAVLQEAGIERAESLLVLTDDDLENFRMAVCARAASPAIAITMRTVDPILADQLEQGLNIRRAYSVAGLAAPTIVAATFEERVLETLRLGSTEIPICQMTVRRNSPLVGLSPAEVERRLRCALIARSSDSGDWSSAADDCVLEVGDGVLVGGLLVDVLELARQNSRLFENLHRRRPKRRGVQNRHFRPTFLPTVATLLATLLFASVLIFWQGLHLSLIDATYFVVTTLTTTGYGDIALKVAPWWAKLYGCGLMLSGAGLMAVLFSHLASVATSERLEEHMGQRARKLSGHVVMCGLGKVGYRVARLFLDLGIPLAIIELSPDPRYVDALRQQAVVLTGDARLPENLERASIENAVAFLGCTNDELVNVQTCLHARRLNPRIITVARTFDEQLAERLSEAFGITVAVSATQAAAGAFVGSASGEHALRSFHVGSLELLAFRFNPSSPVSLETLHEWRLRGILALGFHRSSGAEVAPTSIDTPLYPDEQAILCGPTAAISELLGSGKLSVQELETAQSPG